jgi:hypothetical protein
MIAGDLDIPAMYDVLLRVAVSAEVCAAFLTAQLSNI